MVTPLEVQSVCGSGKDSVGTVAHMASLVAGANGGGSELVPTMTPSSRQDIHILPEVPVFFFVQGLRGSVISPSLTGV